MIIKVKNVAPSNATVVIRNLMRFAVNQGEVADIRGTDGYGRAIVQREIKELIRRGFLEEVNG